MILKILGCTVQTLLMKNLQVECISRASHFTTAVPVFGGKEVIHVEKMPPVAPNFDLSNAFDPPDVGNQGECRPPFNIYPEVLLQVFF
jgi:hypothetical protein